MSDLSAFPVGMASAAPAQAGASNRIGLSIGDIRACAPEDLPMVARLFQSAFRDPASEAPASLHSCLRELFFEHPWYDPELPSRVYIAPDGKLRGFIGVLPLRIVSRRADPRRSPEFHHGRSAGRAPACRRTAAALLSERAAGHFD